MVWLFHLLKKRNQVLYLFGKELISYLSRTSTVHFDAFHENPDPIYTDSHLLTIKVHYHKKNCMLLSCAEIFEASLTKV